MSGDARMVVAHKTEKTVALDTKMVEIKFEEPKAALEKSGDALDDIEKALNRFADENIMDEKLEMKQTETLEGMKTN